MQRRPPEFSPSLTLVVLGRRFQQELESALEPHGLSIRKLGLLGHLLAQPERSFTELAERAGITVQSAHTIVRGMLDDGLIETTGEGGRGRSALLRATPKGLQALDGGRAAISAVDARVFGGEAAAAWQSLSQALEAAAFPGGPSAAGPPDVDRP